MTDLPTYVSPREFSHFSGLSLSTIRRRIRDGSLPVSQPGGSRTRVLIRRDALETPLSAGPSADGQSPPPVFAVQEVQRRADQEVQRS
jgi:hypothetical protein